MEELKLVEINGHIHIEGFPDGVRVIALDDDRARGLADLRLHYTDLMFASQCLDMLEKQAADGWLMREALWRCAVIYYIKCFDGNDARCDLDARKVYAGQPPEAMKSFRYFSDLRDKHIVHDENSYTQCYTGAAINSGNKSYKVEKIVCVATQTDTAGDAGHHRSLRALIDFAVEWVRKAFDSAAQSAGKALEEKDYAKLIAMDELKIPTATVADIKGNRRRSAPATSRPPNRT